MRYTVSFNFHEKPPIEIITPADNAGIEVGQAAFALQRLDCMDVKSVSEFLKAFRSTQLILNGKRVGGTALLSILQLEQADMQAFIETVLLVPFSWRLNTVLPSRRLAVFHHKTPRLERIHRHFQGIALRPVAATRTEIFTALKWGDLRESVLSEQSENETQPEEKPKPNRSERIIIEWENAWKNRESQPDRFNSALAEYNSLTWRYETDNLPAIAWLELYLLAEHNIKVKQCRKCKGYFVPWPANVQSCGKCRQDTTRQALHQANLPEDKKLW